MSKESIEIRFIIFPPQSKIIFLTLFAGALY